MKINIVKLAGGAELLMYRPNPILPSRGVPPDAPVEEIDNSELNAMVGKALTNDANAYAQQYSSTLSQYNSLPDYVKSSVQGRMLRDELKGNWNKLNEIANSKINLGKIVESKKDAMSEYAVYQGHVVAEDVTSGDIVNLTLAEYEENLNSEDSKYKALTNSELVGLRETDPRFVGNDKIFPVLQNAVSTEKVTENVRKALANLGTISKGTTDATYQERQIEEGAKTILNNTYTKSSSGEFFESNGPALKAAGNAMWAMLDPASKDLLRVKAIHEGYKADQVEGAAMGFALGLMKQAYHEKSVTKESDLPGGTAKKAGAGSGEDLKGKGDWFMAAANFNGVEEKMGLVTSPLETGRTAKAKAASYNVGPIRDEDKKAIGIARFNDERLAGLNTIADFDQIYFADQHVPKEKLAGLLYEGDDVHTVLLPFAVDPITEKIHPDFERAQQYTDAVDEIASYNGNISTQQKIDIYNAHGINNLDPKGDPTADVLRPFIVTEAITNNGVVNSSDLVRFKQDSQLENYYESFYGTTKGDMSAPSPGTMTNTKVARAQVFIPMNNGAKLLALFAGKTDIKMSEKYNTFEHYNRVGPGYAGDSGEYRQKQAGVDLSADFK